ASRLSDPALFIDSLIKTMRMLPEEKTPFGRTFEIRGDDALEDRVWRFRVWGESVAPLTNEAPSALSRWAAVEPASELRLQLATPTQRLGLKYGTLPLLHALMQHEEDATDPVIPLMLWLAYEPKLAAAVSAEIAWLQAHAAGNPLLTDHIVPRAMRRL